MHYKCNDAGRCEVILIDKGICYLLSSSIKTQQLIMKLFQSFIILVVLVDCVIVASHITKEEDIQMLVPPVRPRIIATAEDLRRYLQQLNQFYMILSRPRYGRSVSKPVSEMAESS